MKTMLKVTLVVALFAVANTVFASGNLKVNILPVSAEKAVVTISSLDDSNLTISIEDSQGKIVYYNENSDPKDNYRRVYDFSDLEDGQYKLTVACKDLTTECQFQKSHKGIQVGNEKTTLEPFFGYEDGILRCSYLNFSKEKLTLYLFEKNQLIYSKNIGRNFNVIEALNLSKLRRGNYEALLSTGDKEYSYKINIE